MSDLFKLDNKIIVVAGIGVIGSKLVKSLIDAGGIVIISDICKKPSNNFTFKKMDVTNEKSVDMFIDFCLKKHSKIDAWINVSYPHTPNWTKKDNLINYEVWKKNINMHLGGYYLTSIKIAEIMKKQGNGSIINFGSIYGNMAPDFSIYENMDMTTPISYPSIKGGINMLTKYIATYYGKYNIRANVIAPGGIFNNQPKQFVKKYIKRVPLNRMATSKDMIGPVIFLISDASSYITGHVLCVDGGWCIW